MRVDGYLQALFWGGDIASRLIWLAGLVGRYSPRSSLLDISLQFKFSVPYWELVGCGEKLVVVVGVLVTICVDWIRLISSDCWQLAEVLVELDAVCKSVW